jgi:YVTN family beta-propeller protein
MKTKENLDLVVLALTILLLIIFSSTVFIGSAQSTSFKTYAYLTNYDDDSVSIVEITTNTVLDTVKDGVGEDPIGVAAASDGSKLYVANSGSDTISVIDTGTNTVTDTVKGVGKSPTGISVTPDGNKVYVTNHGGNSVSVIDTTSNTVTATVPVGNHPWGVAISPDGSKAYVTNDVDKTVSVIDADTDSVIVTVPIDDDYPGGITINSVGTRVYVTSANSDIISIIDTTTNTVIGTVPVGNYPWNVAVSPDGKKVYATNKGDNTVSVIDATTNTVVDTINVGSRPCAVAVTTNGARVYVTNSGSDSVSIIDTSTNTVTATVNVGSNPRGFGQFIVSLPEAKVETIESKIETSISLDSSASKYKFEDSIVLTATVDSVLQGAEKPSGIVTFMDGDSSIGTETLSSGQAIFITSSLPVGSHIITAEYSGDKNFKSSESSDIILEIHEEQSSPEESSIPERSDTILAPVYNEIKEINNYVTQLNINGDGNVVGSGNIVGDGNEVVTNSNKSDSNDKPGLLDNLNIIIGITAGLVTILGFSLRFFEKQGNKNK